MFQDWIRRNTAGILAAHDGETAARLTRRFSEALERHPITSLNTLQHYLERQMVNLDENGLGETMIAFELAAVHESVIRLQDQMKSMSADTHMLLATN